MTHCEINKARKVCLHMRARTHMHTHTQADAHTCKYPEGISQNNRSDSGFLWFSRFMDDFYFLCIFP